MSRNHFFFIGIAFLVLSGCNQITSPIPAVNISVVPQAAVIGQSATLTWSAADATACTASGAWSGPQATSGTLTIIPSAAGSLSYSLSCTGAGGASNRAATLTVRTPVPPAVNISVSPSPIQANQTSTLTWSSTNANSCTASGDWSGTQATSGSQNFTPSANQNFSYSLTCAGYGGSTTNAAVLTVAPPTAGCTPAAPKPLRRGRANRRLRNS